MAIDKSIKQEDLEKVIEKVLEALMKSGLIKEIKDPKEKKSLVEGIAKTLVADKNFTLTKDDLQKQDTLKNIGLACVAAINPANNFNYARLFHERLEVEPKLDEKLKMILKPMLDKKKLSEEEKKALDMKLGALGAGMEKSLRPEDRTALEKLILSKEILAAEQAKFNQLQKSSPEEAQRRLTSIADYNVDTKNPGSIVPVLLANTAGNQMGRQDLATQGENFMAKLDKPDLGIEDPLGIKLSAVLNALMDGDVNTESDKEMLGLLKGAGFALSMQTPTLTPGGGGS
jgi:hypothetical protein